MITLESPVPTALARTLDPAVPSNALALGATAAGALAGLVWGAGRGGPLRAVRTSVGWGGGAFAAWAIARELDPDHPSTAALAIPLTAAGLALGTPSPPVTLTTLLAARTAAGTVGVALRRTDVAVLALLGGGALASLSRRGRVGRPLDAPSAGVALTAALATATTLPARAVRSRTDVGGRPIQAARIGTARILAAATIGLCALAGRPGVAANTPAVAALVATAVARLSRR